MIRVNITGYCGCVKKYAISCRPVLYIIVKVVCAECIVIEPETRQKSITKSGPEGPQLVEEMEFQNIYVGAYSQYLHKGKLAIE